MQQRINCRNFLPWSWPLFAIVAGPRLPPTTLARIVCSLHGQCCACIYCRRLAPQPSRLFYSIDSPSTHSTKAFRICKSVRLRLYQARTPPLIPQSPPEQFLCFPIQPLPLPISRLHGFSTGIDNLCNRQLCSTPLLSSPLRRWLASRLPRPTAASTRPFPAAASPRTLLTRTIVRLGARPTPTRVLTCAADRETSPATETFATTYVLSLSAASDCLLTHE
jgi:hypothetical protein